MSSGTGVREWTEIELNRSKILLKTNDAALGGAVRALMVPVGNTVIRDREKCTGSIVGALINSYCITFSHPCSLSYLYYPD